MRKLSKLPFVVHDSLLFADVENEGSWNREKKNKDEANAESNGNTDLSTEESGQMTLKLDKPDEGKNDN